MHKARIVSLQALRCYPLALSICLFQKGVEMEAIQELFPYPLYTIAKKNVSETKAYMSKVSWFRRWVGGNGGESMRGHLKKTERNQCKMITKRVLVSMNKKE